MGTICYENGTEKRGISNSAETLTRRYKAKQFASSAAVATALYLDHEFFNDRFSHSGNLMGLANVDISHLADNVYILEAQWSTAEKPVGIHSISGQSGNDAVHVTHSLSTISRIPGPGGGTVPDFKGAVGVHYGQSGLEIAGVDIMAPSLTLTVEYKFAPGTLTFAWYEDQFRIDKTVNLVPWNGFAAGEALYLGPDANNRLTERAEFATFKFAISPNRSNFLVQSVSVPQKLGHDYLWTLFSQDTTGDSLSAKLLGVYVDRVNGYADWTGIIPF